MAYRNNALDIAQYFVREIIGRAWTPADYRGRHIKSASNILKAGYSSDVVIAAIDALANRRYEEFNYTIDELPKGEINGLELLLSWGEPPLIERFVSPPEMPPIYSYDYDAWVKRWGRIAIERGVWDGLYTKQNPSLCPWLEPIIGTTCYERSCEEWQTRQRTLLLSKQSLEQSPIT